VITNLLAIYKDMWGYKFEAMDGNVRAPQILEEAGIPVALKTDHPVLTAVSRNRSLNESLLLSFLTITITHHAARSCA
jgi:imidazolonepropionase-like amidohydrolase